MAKTLVGSVLLVKFYLKGMAMKFKLLIVLVALAPTLVLAQANLPSGVSSSGKPAGMPSVPTPPSQMGRVGDEEQRKPITPGNPVTPTPTNSSGNTTSKKSEGSTMKSTYNVDYCTKNGVTSAC